MDINVLTKHSECSKPDTCMVMVKWTHLDNSEVLYNVSVAPQIDVNFIDNTTIQLNVSYNIFYTVSILSTRCGIESATIIQIHYGTQIIIKFGTCSKLVLHNYSHSKV